MAMRGAIPQAFLVVVTSLVLATVESQSLTVLPSYIAAQRGEQNIFLGCNVTGPEPPNYQIIWNYYPHWSTTEVLIYTTFDNVNKDTTNFTVIKSPLVAGMQSLDLVINTAKPELATQYKCDIPPVPGMGKSAFVEVLDPVECPVSGIEYNEGDEVNITCSVNYFGSEPLHTPSLVWYRNDLGQPISGGLPTAESNTRMTLRLTKNLTSAEDNQEFICVVNFIHSDPQYTDNCSIVVYVRHAVNQVTFYPPSSAEAPVSVSVGEIINCTTNGRPAPTIEWTDIQGNVLGETSDLVVTEGMLSWPQPITLYCSANNTIDNGVTFAMVEGNYTFHVITAAPPVQSAGTEAWVIAVAVIVPIVVLTAIGIAIFFIIRHRKNKKKSKGKTTNGSTSARPTTTTPTATTYSAVPATDFTPATRPPPTSAPRTTAGSTTSSRGPPGPDRRNGAAGGGDSPGFGDLGGVQTYGGSNQAVNTAYPTRSSVHGSNSALGVGAGVSMNPNPGYPVRGSNPALNASIVTNPRPNYPYTGSNSALNTSLSMNPNPAAAGSGASYGRQPSIASSSVRSHASSYNATIPTMEMNRFPNDLSSMHGSEV